MKFILVFMVFGPGAASVTTIGEFSTPEECGHVAKTLLVQAQSKVDKVPRHSTLPGPEWQLHSVCQPVKADTKLPSHPPQLKKSA